MKRIRALFLSLIIVLSLVPNVAFATITTNGKCGGNLTWTLDDTGELIISGIGAMAGDSPWDEYSDSITKIIIGDGVTSIGDSAFAYCDSLRSVTIPSSVKSISDYAFYECSSLTDVTIPNNVTVIGGYAFYRCYSLESATIGNSVRSIGDYAFAYCYNLTSVTFLGDAPNMEEDSFEGVTATVQYPIQNDTWVQYGMGSYGGDLTWKPEGTLAAPELHISKSDGKINLSWKYVSGAQFYEIYRSTDGKKFKYYDYVFDTTNYTVSYVDSSVTSGKKYYYKVKAGVCAWGSGYSDYIKDYYSDYSAVKSAIPLSTPNITGITNDGTGITVKWNKVVGATAYQVYRKVGTGEWKLIKTTTSTSLTNTKLTNGTKYQYKIRAITKKDGEIVNKSSYSAIKTMYRLTCPTLASGTKNIATKKIVVKWNKNTKATGYQIKYVKGSTTKTVKVTKASTLSKTLSKLTKGSTYMVSVRSYKTVSGTTYYSAYSAVKSVKVTK